MKTIEISIGHGLLTYVDSVDLRSDAGVKLGGSVKLGCLDNSRGIHPPDRNAVMFLH